MIVMETMILEREGFDHGQELRPTSFVEHAPAPGAALVRIAVRSMNRIVIVQVADIIRLEAEDNYVRIWTDRPHLHKETLTGLMARLDPAGTLRLTLRRTVGPGSTEDDNGITPGWVSASGD